MSDPMRTDEQWADDGPALLVEKHRLESQLVEERGKNKRLREVLGFCIERINADPPNPYAMMAALDAIGNEARAVLSSTGSEE